MGFRFGLVLIVALLAADVYVILFLVCVVLDVAFCERGVEVSDTYPFFGFCGVRIVLVLRREFGLICFHSSVVVWSLFWGGVSGYNSCCVPLASGLVCEFLSVGSGLQMGLGFLLFSALIKPG